MIVISGALVLVALVLLVIGVVDPSLPFVYASIAVSLVSLVFLVIGILQRRGEPLPSDEAASASKDGAPAAPPVSLEKESTAVVPAQAVRSSAPAASPAEDLETGGTVLVVSGRPRYHVDGCRYLSGKDAEPIDVLDAREEGFTPCGVCKPDDALVPVEEPTTALELASENEVEQEPEAVEPEPARATGRKAKTARPAQAARAATRTVPDPLEQVAAGRGATPSRASAGKAAAPAKTAKTAATKTAAKAPAKAAEQAPAKAAAKAPAKVPGKTAAKTPAKTAAKTPAKSPAKAPAAAAPAKKAGGVVVIPERGRFHRADCRYVRGVDGAEVLTKAQATKQGFEACGVCKP